MSLRQQCHTQPQFSSSAITKQRSTLKLIQGPYLLMGKQGSKDGLQFGGAVKEMQVIES